MRTIDALVFAGIAALSAACISAINRPEPMPPPVAAKVCPAPERHPGADEWICGEAQWIARFPESFDAYACFRPKEFK